MRSNLTVHLTVPLTLFLILTNKESVLYLGELTGHWGDNFLVNGDVF